MNSDGDRINIDEENARAGSTPRIVRYVLIISTLLAIAILSIIWITGAQSVPDETETSSAIEETAPDPAQTD